MQDHYKVLGIERNSSQNDIKTAYRRMASKYHPDKGGSKEMFQSIEEAYRVLSDPQKRQEYDNPPIPPQGFGGFPGGFNFNNGHVNINDIFNMFMHDHVRRNQQQTYRTVVFVTLEQAYYGGEQNLKIDTNNESHFVKIIIPKGIQNGMQIKYEQIIQNANLIVEFRINKNLKFERINNDLHCNYSISVLDLIVGTEIEVTTLDEKTISIKVPPRTNPNAQLKVSGKGMPVFQGNNYGDLYINIKPFMPDNIDKSIIDSIQNSKLR